MFDKKRLKLLTPEQLVTVNRWESEKLARNEIYNQIKNGKFIENYSEKISDTDADECEHGRGWTSDCINCDEIRRILFSEEHMDDDSA